ncbi:MAG TPA: PIN domain-containing protein [Verrucomicrobiae bacterium]|nr:PIN domain-containing protein [Verrucomicrobiae bacterium]
MTANENTDPKLPVNYVFVDYENMHELDPALIGRKTVHLTLLLGAHQKKLDSTLVQKLVAHAASVQLVQLNSPGRNALDFALAFYLGKAAQADPTAYFHIVSKDTGFDPLIEHLQSHHIRARRHDDYTSLTFTSPAKLVAESPEELFTRVTTHLRNNAKNRPKRKKTLESHLAALCGGAMSANGVHELIDKLCKAGLAIGEKDVVTYPVDWK